MITKEQLLEALRKVEDPDLKKSLVELDMIKNIQLEGSKVRFEVELTTPA
ncbi:MAG: iron-sulfur cluster assembly protein, partial [Bacteroidota bacterium]|nr:iron-sulfur cluster assembly protein [Bacteroidota bacterium]